MDRVISKLASAIVDMVEFRRVRYRTNPISRSTTDKCSEYNPKIGPLTDEKTSRPQCLRCFLSVAIMRKRALESNQTTQRDWEGAIMKMAVSMLVFVFMYVLLVRIVYKLSGVLIKWVKKSPFHSLMNNPCKKILYFRHPSRLFCFKWRFQILLTFLRQSKIWTPIAGGGKTVAKVGLPYTKV